MSTTQITPDLAIVKTEHPNATALREGFAAFARGDLEHVRGRLTEDCVWTLRGSSALAGTYRGWNEIEAMFGALFEATGGTFSMDVLSCVADDARAIAVYDATSTVAGQTRTLRFVMIEDLAPDGLASDVISLAYDQAAADAHMNAIPQQR